MFSSLHSGVFCYSICLRLLKGGVSLNTIIGKDDFRLRVHFSSLETQVSIYVKTTVQCLIYCQYIKINGLNSSQT